MEEITEKSKRKTLSLKAKGKKVAEVALLLKLFLYIVYLYYKQQYLFTEELRILLPTATTPQPTQKQTTVSNSGDYDDKRCQ